MTPLGEHHERSNGSDTGGDSTLVPTREVRASWPLGYRRQRGASLRWLGQ